ncbi:MAG: hypothetical protein AB7V58_13730 [Solirubrobacterales bacterium]
MEVPDPIDRQPSPGEALANAAAYPYPAPLRSFVQVGDRTHDLPETPDLVGRRPLLAYGANASPQVLAEKLAPLPAEPLPVLRAGLADFDVVYSAHISPYGAVPSTLQRSAGTVAPVYVAYPTAEQEEAIVATEPNYELAQLELEVRTVEGEDLSVLDAFVSRHGCLSLDGGEVAVAAIESAGRHLPSLGEIEVLERVRAILAPELDLERFVESSLDPGLAAARTAVLRGNAIPLAL